jgi:hypothetical protein
MKNSNEQKSNFVHRLINSTLKFKKEHIDNQSKSSVHKFKYELPESFLKAVDNARLTAGYNILPRRRHRSASPAIDQKTSSSSFTDSDNEDQIKSKITCSFSTNDLDRISTKKIQFRRTPRRPMQHHRPTTPHPIFFSPRPPFRMMMNSNLMWMNRSPRPANVSPIPLPQRPAIFRLRFR